MGESVRGGGHADLDLVRRALGGEEDACASIVRDVAPRVQAAVSRMCADEASRQRARDIVSEMISDCFGATARPRGDAVLLRYYDGRAPLFHWLCTVATSRLRNWWKSGRARFEVAEGDAGREVAVDPGGGDPEVGELLAVALGRAFERAPRKEMVWLRLVFLHGIPKQEVARLWGVHPSGVSRGLAACLGEIRASTLAYLRAVDPHLDMEWEDCLVACEQMLAFASGGVRA